LVAKRYPIVQILWEDAAIYIDVDAKPETVPVITVGLLKKKTKDTLAVAVSWWPSENVWDGVIAIPRKTVKEMKIIDYASQ
jgi:hypothetical protein